MRVWDRLLGKDSKRLLRVAVVGTNNDAQHLRDAYGALADFAVVTACEQEARTLIDRKEIEALEVCLPPLKAIEIALEGLRAGLFVSTTCPLDLAALSRLEIAAAENLGTLRIRKLPLYYPPYLEMKRLLDSDAIGLPTMMKISIRYGKGTVLPSPLNPAAWIREHDVGFLALGIMLLGPAIKAQADCKPLLVGSIPASSVLTWRSEQEHRFGYLQLDFCPNLAIRTLTDPVHRSIELTGVGGIIFANRGEGQLMRQPSLILRSKSTTTAFELLNDDWQEVFAGLAQETAAALKEGQPVRANVWIAEQSIKILDLAGI